MRFTFLSTAISRMLVALLGSILFCFAPQAAKASTFFVDCSSGVTGNGSSANPWNTLTDVNSHVFVAGDTLLFKRGTTCSGMFQPQGSGVSGSPIVVDATGTGSLPVIAGGGLSNAILLMNVQYWELNNLEVTNTGASTANRRGVYLLAKDVGTINHLYLKGLYVHDVNGDEATNVGGSAGINIAVGGTSVPTQYNDILVQNCTVRNTNRAGIRSASSWNGDRPVSYTTNWPTGWTNVRFTGNHVYNVGGDGILVEHSQHPIVDHNVVRGANQRSTGYNVGLWAFDTNDALIQYNEVSDTGKGGGDGTGYDEDYNQDHTVFQYNYSHNNYGGFMLNCEACGSPAGTNSVVRYNISVDDGQGTSHPMGGVEFYGNTVYLSTATTSRFKKVNGNNNIFYEAKPTPDTVTCALTCGNNVMYNVTGAGTGNITADPLFFQAGSVPTGLGSLNGYQLNAGSPALGAGSVMSDAPAVDFFGHSISATANPNMGADNGPGGSDTNLLGNAGFETGGFSPWSPVGSTSVVNSPVRSGAYAVQVGPGTASAEQIVSGLAPTNSYTFGGYGQVTSSGQQVRLGAKNFDGTSLQVGQSIGTTSYTAGHASFTTGATNTSAKVYVYDQTGTSYGYGDDLYLVRDALSNPGLETGSVDPWSNSSSITLTTTDQHSGSYALQLGGAPATTQQVITGLAPETNYVFSGWAKVATAGEDVTLGAKNVDAAGTQTTLHVTSASYQLGLANFTTGATNTTATVFCYKYAGGGAGYCDDLSVGLNLVDNPGFESGGFGAWSPASTAAAITSSGQRSGNQAVVLHGSGANFSQTVCGLEPNRRYNAQAWIKAGASSSAQIQVSAFGGSTTAGNAVTSTSYAPSAVTFVTGASNTCATVTVTQTAGTSDSYVDDTSFAASAPI